MGAWVGAVDWTLAQAVNARPILVRTGNGSKTEQQHSDALQDIEIYDDLASTVDTLINEYGSQA